MYAGFRRPGLDHIFIRLGLASSTPPSLSGLHAHTCVGALLRSEPMWQYPANITNNQVDINSVIPKWIDGVPSFTCQRSLMA
jgi:hypothetical protein